MPNYGDADYWNHRYGVDFPEPFDWLFSYVDVKEILNQVIEREKEVLMIGSGNADFSPDMLYNDGYHNLTNIDLSDVVIDQMKNKHPEMKWLVMDALNTTFESNSIETIVDKSLIDTILCYPNSVECTKKLIAECYRVLAEGGIHISFSLHSVDDVLAYFRHKDFKWEVKPYRIINPRWNSSESKRSVAHTMIICQKLPLNPNFPQEIKGVLSDKEYDELVERATKINEESLFKKASLQRMLDSLDRALELQLASLPLKPLPAVDVSNE